MDKIDELLMQHYEWSQGYAPALGFGRADPTCRDFRISRQWMDYDDLDAAVEWNLKESTGKALEPLIQKLETRYRVSINAAMRNFQAGVSVWNVEHYEEAKEILCPKLVMLGLIDKATCKPLRNPVQFETVVAELPPKFAKSHRSLAG